MEWFLILVHFVAIIAILLVVVAFCIKFFNMPTQEQISNIKEWLKWAVTQAEKELQGGTGQLKLRMVYDMFVTKFPSIARIIKFETFSAWVDESLEWLKAQLSSNENIKNLVENENK